MQSPFARQMGFELADLRAVTFMGFHGEDDRSGLLMRLTCDEPE